MDELKTVSALVKKMLTDYPETRNSDYKLYSRILQFYGNLEGVDTKTMNVGTMFRLIEQKVLPAFETVRRSRQKVQEHHPELAATERTGRARAEREEDFRAFARSEI